MIEIHKNIIEDRFHTQQECQIWNENTYNFSRDRFALKCWYIRDSGSSTAWPCASWNDELI